MKARPFSELHPGHGDRYGPLFQAVRRMPCWLYVVRYEGRGHPSCGKGVQDSPRSGPLGLTAHHLGRLDEEGLIPCCGLAHDLLAGLGGRSTREEFEGWLKRHGYELKEVGKLYVAKARDVAQYEPFPED